MQTVTRRIQGCDGISLHLTHWAPDDILDAKGVIQLLHGQGEYAARYTHVAQYLTDRGFIVYAPDLRGHGLLAFNPPEDAREEHAIPGHMADEDGWSKCVADFGILRDIIRSEQPMLPLFLIGHSLGSLMAQDLLMQYSTRWYGAGFCERPLPSSHSALCSTRCNDGNDVFARWLDFMVQYPGRNRVSTKIKKCHGF